MCCFVAFRMGQEPFVTGSEKLIFGRSDLKILRYIRVGTPGEDDQDAEAVRVLRAAGCIVKGRGIDLDERARRDQEGLHLCGIKEAVGNLFLSGKKQDELLCAEIELAVPVVLQAVQVAIMSAAPAQLHRHPAKTVGIPPKQ